MAFSNIIFIHGNNSYLIERERRGFLEIFAKKYGAENIQHCSLDDTDAYGTYRNELQMMGLFQEKRLFLFSGGREKKSDAPGFEMILEEIAASISPDDFLIFSHINAGEPALITWLEKHASTRHMVLTWNVSDWERFTSLSSPSISRVLAYYAQAERQRDKGDVNPFLGHAIAHTLQSLGLFESSGKTITPTIIEQFSYAYEGAKIFDLIDTILRGKITDSIALLRTITQDMNTGEVQRFYASFVGILRQSLYIITLRDLGKKESEIAPLLGKIHPYVVGKNYNSPIKSATLSRFFSQVVHSSIAYKRGAGMKKTEL